jgi:hypothetical protein
MIKEWRWCDLLAFIGEKSKDIAGSAQWGLELKLIIGIHSTFLSVSCWFEFQILRLQMESEFL